MDLLAEDLSTGRLVGVVTGAAYEQDWEPQGCSEACSDSLGVLRSHRGRGIAAALLQDAMRRMALAGLDAAGLGVDSANPSGAVALYERLGYRATSRTVALEWQPPA